MTAATTTWWWVRHAPVPGRPGVIYGQMDVDCDTADTGSLQALAHALPADACWLTTPLKRTQQTYAAIAAVASMPPPVPEIDAGLVEQTSAPGRDSTGQRCKRATLPATPLSGPTRHEMPHLAVRASLR
ncbi:histidine phosphatase family protein [Defluviicoccus vanus]|uniref:Histidine phosphatase family protein n=1 Tax=Defluviicoccus vanus TaxID=111831 RepID=A0A7H1MX52_9PROT|nr:histidine phosphatase family protein [Defluviicoccus vanus]QNT68038.1 histidine phosphatase family protein [Defluviicoccus vanus]